MHGDTHTTAARMACCCRRRCYCSDGTLRWRMHAGRGSFRVAAAAEAAMVAMVVVAVAAACLITGALGVAMYPSASTSNTSLLTT
jgi:hypothetical protein